MNLLSFLKRGAGHAPTDAERYRQKTTAAAERARGLWLESLIVDETRAWMDLGVQQEEVLNGLATMLTLAGFCLAHDYPDDNSAAIRIIRGGISTATTCAKGGFVIEAHHATALSSSCTQAREAIAKASVDAILYASVEMRKTVGLSV